MSEATPFADRAPAVRVEIEPDEKLTTDWLKRLLADAQARAARARGPKAA